MLLVLGLACTFRPAQAQPAEQPSEADVRVAWTASDVRVVVRYLPLNRVGGLGTPTSSPIKELLPAWPRSHETARRDTTFSGRPADRWLAFDKVQHFTFSFLWTLGSQYTFVNKWGLSERGALPLSITSGAAIGLAKEFYDWRVKPSHYFGRRDLVADGLGIALAVGWVLL
ncbi:MAG: hypothetical protein ACR2GR_01170 [Rhodothermales bacterium]